MDQQQQIIVYRSVNDLIPYARNSRTHSEEQVLQIAASIKEFGFTNPVLIDRDGGIIAGHGRVMAARKVGMDQVPTIELVHLTETQKRAYIIADNKMALNSGWDNELLAVEFAELSNEGFDLSLIGFSDKDLSLIFDETKHIDIENINANKEEKNETINITVQCDIEYSLDVIDRLNLICKEIPRVKIICNEQV